MTVGWLARIPSPEPPPIPHLHLFLVGADVDGTTDDAFLGQKLLRLLADGQLQVGGQRVAGARVVAPVEGQQLRLRLDLVPLVGLRARGLGA